jgi:hypothetical protein
MALGPRHDRIISATLGDSLLGSKRGVKWKTDVRLCSGDIRQLSFATDLSLTTIGVHYHHRSLHFGGVSGLGTKKRGS